MTNGAGASRWRVRVGWLAATLLAAAAYVVAGQPAAPAEASSNCWTYDVGYENRGYEWVLVPGAVRLQSCFYDDGEQIWAKSRLIGPANTKMYGRLQVELMACTTGQVDGGTKRIWDGHDADAYDYGEQQYGSTYFTNVWTSKLTVPEGARMRIRVKLMGAVTYPDPSNYSFGLSSAGVGAEPPGEYHYAPADDLGPGRCVVAS